MVLSPFADLFDQVAPSYHRLWLPVIEPAAVRLLDYIAPVVAARPDALVVDIGAGTGALGRAAVARWPAVRVVGVDPSEGMLALGDAVAASLLAPPARARLTWLTGVAERLPFDSASADAVVSSFAWQFVPARALRGRRGSTAAVPQ